jgi:hypothetical protein
VYWEGDVGCAGGNGTVVPNFTVVEQNGYSHVSPVVVTDFKFPELELTLLTGLSIQRGKLLIEGIAYTPNDQQGLPTKKVSYAFEIDQLNRAFILR